MPLQNARLTPEERWCAGDLILIYTLAWEIKGLRCNLCVAALVVEHNVRTLVAQIARCNRDVRCDSNRISPNR